MVNFFLIFLFVFLQGRVSLTALIFFFNIMILVLCVNLEVFLDKMNI